jgi:uncharacterized membrane protein
MTLTKAAGIGALSGMRSVSTLAILSDQMARRSKRKASLKKALNAKNISLDLLKLPQTAQVLKMMAAGEALADKMPMMPARTAPLPLAGRALIGAVAGASMDSEDRLRGGGVGALSAVVSAHLAYRIRRMLRERFSIPDPLLGAIEDAAVLAAAQALAKSRKR